MSQHIRVNSPCGSRASSSGGWRRGIVALVAIVVLLIAGFMLDRVAYDAWRNVPEAWIDNDLYRMFRVMGYLPLWLIVSAALLLMDAPLRRTHGVHRAISRAGLLASSTVLAGALAEAMKWTIRRQRPPAGWTGDYVFRSWDRWAEGTAGLGLPSSHALVAFAAAFMLCRMHPRGWPVWIAAAIGCGVTRLMNAPHYLSDVVVAAVAAWLVVAAVYRVHLRLRQRFETAPAC